MKISKLFLFPMLLLALGCFNVKRECLPFGEGVRWTCYDRVSSGGFLDASNNNIRAYDVTFQKPVPAEKTPEEVGAKVEKIEVLPTTVATQEGAINKFMGTIGNTATGANAAGYWAREAAKALRPTQINESTTVTGVSGDVKAEAEGGSGGKSVIEKGAVATTNNNSPIAYGQGGQGGQGGKGGVANAKGGNATGGSIQPGAVQVTAQGGQGGSTGPVNVKAEGGNAEAEIKDSGNSKIIGSGNSSSGSYSNSDSFSNSNSSAANYNSNKNVGGPIDVDVKVQPGESGGRHGRHGKGWD